MHNYARIREKNCGIFQRFLKENLIFLKQTKNRARSVILEVVRNILSGRPRKLAYGIKSYKFLKFPPFFLVVYKFDFFVIFHHFIEKCFQNSVLKI